MNNIEQELSRAWTKARSFPGELKLLSPTDLDPLFAAQTFIKLLQQTYVSHGVSQQSKEFASKIHKNQIEPWIVTRNDLPIACAALIRQSDGTKEVGRAVSIENGSGAGKIAMLEAALNKGSSQLVAEIRLADEFAGVPSSEATQRICHGIIGLTIHAILPPFRHGKHPITGDKYNEMFGFASEKFKLINNSPIQTAHIALAGRSPTGLPKNIQQIQSMPFKVAVLSDAGQNINDFHKNSRHGYPGCTMVSAEVIDQNLATITWLMEHDFILSGIDRNAGENGLPVLLLSTLAHGTILAPSIASNILPSQTRNDILQISNQFNHLLKRS